MVSNVIPKGNPAHDLQQAIIAGNRELVLSILLQKHADVNSLVIGKTALSLTISQNKYDLFSILLENASVNVNVRSKLMKNNLEAPIVTACRISNVDMVKKLLQFKNLDINVVDNHGRGAVWMCARQGEYDILKSLLIAGASSEMLPSTWSQSPLYCDIRYTQNTSKIAELLILNGANVRITTPAHQTSLAHLAITQNRVHLAYLLVQAGCWLSFDTKLKADFHSKALDEYLTADDQDWLTMEINNPPSLQRQCSISIRTQLFKATKGSFFLKTLYKLPLPKPLLDNISLLNIVDKQISNDMFFND
ncbi:DgyrCDS7460 [Dimorphilus gyrociliatus]|uniref:DgyrCDS7460 n=1 Tax=Dimorphilus gyrociliatus TaxID=2664684 RepID=A0A7I8VW18_9ANNE|nr:DgyrCDS7460 [Dimorphilus gyrociliatus]